MKYRTKNIVPSLFTMLNLFFGFFAIVHAIQDKLVTASWLILIAAIWDSVDGKIARFTESYSDFGIEFDSLADVVSFGVAPSMLIYQVFLYQLGPFGIILSFLPLLFGAIRLARFNVNQDGFEKENFSGLPIPAMAATISTYVIFNYDLWEGLKFAPALIPLVLLLCFLMVSNVEYVSMPKFSFKEDKKNSFLLMSLLAGLTLIIVFRQKALFPLLMLFVLYYLLKSVFPGHKEEEEDVLDIRISD